MPLENKTSLPHFAEYTMEAALLGLFMISACTFGVLLEHPQSPLHQAIPEAFVRRIFMGLAMGLTSLSLVLSPMGKRSGAHFNPAVTLAFLRLGKIHARDAAGYILGQFAGGIAGVALAAAILSGVADPTVNYVATTPGAQGPWVAFAAEIVISFGMMTMVLQTSNRRHLARFTPVFAGLLVATYITFEAPISGMSMNPARTFGSAIPAQLWSLLWIYFLAPPAGMLLAAELYVRTRGLHQVFCAKLHHANTARCIFRCNYGQLAAVAAMLVLASSTLSAAPDAGSITQTGSPFMALAFIMALAVLIRAMHQHVHTPSPAKRASKGLSAVVVLLAASHTASAESRQELGLMLGIAHPSSRTAQSANPIDFSNGKTLLANYGIRLTGGKSTALYFEIPFAATPQHELSSPLRAVTRDVATLYLTPGLRLKFAPGARISPYVAAGGGYALFEHSTELINGAANPVQRRNSSGAFDFGGGADIRFLRFASLRGEIRDYISGSPLFAVPVNGSAQHNIIVSGGIVFNFGKKIR